jgi:hypothetical protein
MTTHLQSNDSYLIDSDEEMQRLDRQAAIYGTADDLAHLLVIMQGAQGRHRDVTDPIEVLAAFGGFEVAVMVGAAAKASVMGTLSTATSVAGPVRPAPDQ